MIDRQSYKELQPICQNILCFLQGLMRPGGPQEMVVSGVTPAAHYTKFNEEEETCRGAARPSYLERLDAVAFT